MPKPPSEQYKFDTEGERIPATEVTRQTEGRMKIAEGQETVTNADTRPSQSEAVGADSAPGWVKRNKGQFEQTEGRM